MLLLIHLFRLSRLELFITDPRSIADADAIVLTEWIATLSNRCITKVFFLSYPENLELTVIWVRVQVSDPSQDTQTSRHTHSRGWVLDNAKSQRRSPRCEIRPKVRKNRAGGAGGDTVSQECKRSPRMWAVTCTDLLTYDKTQDLYVFAASGM